MLSLVDSHCHIYMIEDDAGDVILRAKHSGVDILLNVCVEIDKLDSVLQETWREGVYASVGQHPLSSKEGGAKLTDKIVELVKSNDKLIAIGETGLDYYRNDDVSFWKLQRESFESHAEAAVITGLPLIIHSRKADVDTLDVLKKYNGKVKFIMHCFGGDAEFAGKCLDLGGYISFSGILTFKNALDSHIACQFVPLDRMLIETDSPYLAPVPHRGKRNEPSYVKFVAEQVAQIKEISLSEVARITTSNFAALTGIDTN